jgi:uncharacterized protein (TIGR01777 family)
MRALVTGATGFIGRRLCAHLERPVVLSRDPDRAREALGDVEAFAWDAEAGPPPAEAFRGVEAVFHLAGDPVGDARWSDEKKRRIRESRVLGTRRLVGAIGTLDAPPRVLVSASAVGIYGARGEEVLDESSPPGDDFLADVCRAWESEALAARARGVRVVNPRIGIVLGEGGGALAKMLPLFKLCLGGRLGDGRQWMPWVHVDDVVGIMRFAAERADVEGPINAVAPAPVTNRDFTRALAHVLGRPAVLPAPAFALRLGVGEFARVLLGSQRVVPRAAERAGYRFQHPEIEAALRAILLRAHAPAAAS